MRELCRFGPSAAAAAAAACLSRATPAAHAETAAARQRPTGTPSPYGSQTDVLVGLPKRVKRQRGNPFIRFHTLTLQGADPFSSLSVSLCLPFVPRAPL